MIRNEIGAIIKLSSIYETESWGFNTEQLFLNQVILIETDCNAIDTLSLLLNTEKQLGRKRSSNNYESRSIDLDILFFNDTINNSKELQVPHPRLHQRMFTLVPLNEIASQKIHPVFNEKISTLKEKCSDKSKVNLFKLVN